MAARAFVRARIDETLKNEAAAVLAGMGCNRHLERADCSSGRLKNAALAREG